MIFAGEARVGPLLFPRIREQHIRHFPPRQVSALEQHGLAALCQQAPAGRPGFGRRGCRHAGQGFEFPGVGRDEGGHADQTAHGGNGRCVGQFRPAGGHHDRIHDQGQARRGSAQDIGDCGDGGGGTQHAGLDGAYGQVREHAEQLGPNHVGLYRRKRLHAQGILRGQGGNDAGAVNAVGDKGFQVRLDTRPTAAIRAGDGQGRRGQHLGRHVRYPGSPMEIVAF